MSVLIVSLRGVSDGASFRTTPKEARGKGRLQYKLDEASLSSVKDDDDDDKTLSSIEYDGDDELASEGEDDDDDDGARTNTQAVDAEREKEKEDEVPALKHGPLTLEEYLAERQELEHVHQQEWWNEFQSLFFENQQLRREQQENQLSLSDARNTILRVQLHLAQRETEIEEHREGFKTLQAAAEYAYKAHAQANEANEQAQNAQQNAAHANNALGAGLVLSAELFHRRELAQEQENNN